MTEEVNHPKSVFSPSWDHRNMYVTLQGSFMFLLLFLPLVLVGMGQHNSSLGK